MFGLAKYIWAESKDAKKPFTVSVAESVTAGALTNTISSEPGASKFFLGGITTYSIQSKKDILSIDIEYAEKNNFANVFTTSEMARAACKMFGSRIGMSTTGYSLPIKRDEDKELGLCALNVEHPYAYVCLYDSATDHEMIKKITFTYNPKSSDRVQRASVQTRVALEGREMYITYKESVDKRSDETAAAVVAAAADISGINTE